MIPKTSVSCSYQITAYVWYCKIQSTH